MIMPFLRLVIIYIVVILGALLVFKRDSVMSLLGNSDAEITATVDEPVKVAEPVAQAKTDAAGTNNAAADTQTATEPEATQPEQPSKYPTEETAQTTAPKPELAETAPAQDIQSRLEDARNAYWSRDLEGAETLYKSLVNDAPTNADIKGELGNLYFAQRRMDEAAQMYHQTGLQLIADGNTRQIMPLIGVLQSIAPDKANDLRTRLSQ